MPDMKLAYIVNNVGEGNRYLSDSMEFVPLMLSQNGNANMDGSSYQTCSMSTMPTEIFIVGLGCYGRRPLLFIRTKVDLLIYQVTFDLKQDQNESCLKKFYLSLRHFIIPSLYSYATLGLSIRTRPFENSIP